MSTKSTLNCGEGYHLYEDINFENGEVFLKIECPFLVIRSGYKVNGGATIELMIPKEIWNEIIKIGPRTQTIAG